VRLYARYRPAYAPASPYDNSWKNVAEITNYGEIRKISNIMRFEAVSRRYALKGKGSEDINDVTLQYGFDYTDAGQQLLRDARDADFDFQFKIALRDFVIAEDGTRTWTNIMFRAYVTDYALNPGGVNAWVMAESKMSLIAPSLTYLRPTKAGIPTVEDEESETDDYPLLEAPYVTEETGEED
jgi:hypothetical protein